MGLNVVGDDAVLFTPAAWLVFATTALGTHQLSDGTIAGHSLHMQ
ncbi:hypothetical protein DEU38_12321 [Rhodococcus sp. AG1013]|nr:hypothetical protein DEU38_12321 [Rhodococcus sp. AG1013]